MELDNKAYVPVKQLVIAAAVNTKRYKIQIPVVNFGARYSGNDNCTLGRNVKSSTLGCRLFATSVRRLWNLNPQMTTSVLKGNKGFAVSFFRNNRCAIC